MITQLVDMGIVSYVCDEVLRQIQERPDLLDASELAKLRALFDERGGVDEFDLSLTGERLIFDDTIDFLYKSNGRLSNRSKTVVEEELAGRGRGQTIANRDEDIAAYDAWEDVAASILATPAWRRRGPTPDEHILLAATRRNGVHATATSMVAPVLSTALRSLVRTKTLVSAVRVAIAASEQRLATGSWPASVGGLEPAPIDHFSGEPVRYRLGEDGPVIYSAGEDMDDDGGRARVDSEGVGVEPEWRPVDEIERMSGEEAAGIDGDWVLFPLGGEGEARGGGGD